MSKDTSGNESRIAYYQTPNGWGFEVDVQPSLHEFIPEMKKLMTEYSNSWPSGHEDFTDAFHLTPINRNLQLLMVPFNNVREGRGGCGISAIGIPRSCILNEIIPIPAIVQTLAKSPLNMDLQFPMLNSDENANPFETGVIEEQRHLLPAQVIIPADQYLGDQTFFDIIPYVHGRNVASITIAKPSLDIGTMIASNLWNAHAVNSRMELSVMCHAPSTSESLPSGRHIAITIGGDVMQHPPADADSLTLSAIQKCGRGAGYVWNVAERRSLDTERHIDAEEWMEVALELKPAIEMLHVVALTSGLDAANMAVHTFLQTGKNPILAIESWISALKAYESLHNEIEHSDFLSYLWKYTVKTLLMLKQPQPSTQFLHGSEAHFTMFINQFAFKNPVVDYDPYATAQALLQTISEPDFSDVADWGGFWRNTPIIRQILAKPFSSITDPRGKERSVVESINTLFRGNPAYFISTALEGHSDTWIPHFIHLLRDSSNQLSQDSYYGVVRFIMNSKQHTFLESLLSSQRQNGSRYPLLWLLDEFALSNNLIDSWLFHAIYIEQLLRIQSTDERQSLLESSFNALNNRYIGEIPNIIAKTLTGFENKLFPSDKPYVWRHHDLGKLGFGDKPSFEPKSIVVSEKVKKHNKSLLKDSKFAPSLIPPLKIATLKLLRKGADRVDFSKYARKEGPLSPFRIPSTILFVFIRGLMLLTAIDLCGFFIRYSVQVASLIPSINIELGWNSLINGLLEYVGFSIYDTGFWAWSPMLVSIISSLIMLITFVTLIFGDLHIYRQFRKWRKSD